MNKNLSRRNFLKSTSVLLATTGLVGLGYKTGKNSTSTYGLQEQEPLTSRELSLKESSVRQELVLQGCDNHRFFEAQFSNPYSLSTYLREWQKGFDLLSVPNQEVAIQNGQEIWRSQLLSESWLVDWRKHTIKIFPDRHAQYLADAGGRFAGLCVSPNPSQKV